MNVLSIILCCICVILGIKLIVDSFIATNKLYKFTQEEKKKEKNSLTFKNAKKENSQKTQELIAQITAEVNQKSFPEDVNQNLFPNRVVRNHAKHPRQKNKYTITSN